MKFNSGDTDICLLQKNENDPVSLCSEDIGAPFVCDGSLIGNIYFFPKSGVVRYKDIKDVVYPVTSIYPEIDWVKYFITERTSSSVRLYSNLYRTCMCIMVIKVLISF